MTDAEAEALGRRLVACEGFRDVPGMRWCGHAGHWRSVDRTDEEAMAYGAANAQWWDPEPVDGDRWPDLRDPATRGCVLELVREKHGARTCVEVWSNSPMPWTVFSDRLRRPVIADGNTEAEALVAALEAAK